MMIIGLILGFAAGTFIGILVGTMLKESVQQNLINDYKQSVDYWFKATMKAEKAYYDLLKMYTDELIKRV